MKCGLLEDRIEFFLFSKCFRSFILFVIFVMIVIVLNILFCQAGSPKADSSLHILFLFFISAMFFVSLWSLFGYHIYLMLYNRTTLGKSCNISYFSLFHLILCQAFVGRL